MPSSSAVHIGEPERQFYRTQGLFTSLADTEIGDLPVDPGELREVVSGLVVHGDLCHLYDFSPGADWLTEMNLRPLTEMLAVVREKSAQPLSSTRPAHERLIGSCRSFAVLLVALLREQGLPSRVRAGFAAYFDPGVWDDHWIAEYWTGDRWCRTDAELDAVVRAEYRVAFAPGDVPDGAFLAGSEAWRRYRRGEVDPGLCGFENIRGPLNIAGGVIRDLAALTKHEMLPWDYWGRTDDWDQGRSTVDEAEIDEIAATVLDGDLDDVLRIARRPGLAVPADLGLVRADR